MLTGLAQDILLFLIGLVVLCWGADIFVAGASRLAALMRVSPTLIAVTVVAFGTSAPELFTALEAASRSVDDPSMGGLVLGNIIGSNICNIALVIGLCAIFMPFKMDRGFLSNEFIFFVLSAFALYFFLYKDQTLSGLEGVLLLVFMALFSFLCVDDALDDRRTLKFVKEDIVPQLEKPPQKGWRRYRRSLLYIVGGLIGLKVGSYFLIESGSKIGVVAFGMSPEQIGLFMVAVGTSLPELAISLMAAIKKEQEIAIGNIVGSNVFNILFVGGIASSLYPLEVSVNMVAWDLPIMLLFSMVFMIFLRIEKMISRFEGALLLTGFILYIGDMFI